MKLLFNKRVLNTTYFYCSRYNNIVQLNTSINYHILRTVEPINMCMGIAVFLYLLIIKLCLVVVGGNWYLLFTL